MRTVFRSLYWKVSAIFLVLLLALGAVFLLVSLHTSADFVVETDQKLNRTLARDLAERFRPFLQDSLNEAGIEHTFHELMVMNPRVEIYLLDENGRVLAYFADPKKIKRTSVAIGPIRRFLEGTQPLPIYGDDPRSPDRRKPFSATPVRIGKRQRGYLYVIIGGEQYDSIASMVAESYIARNGVFVLVGALLVTGLAGLVLFSLLTQRLRTMTVAVRRFEQGDFRQRVAVGADDEIGQLGKAFNQMAEAIVTSVEKLKRNDALRRELVANVSHDLRGPLASIQGYLETVLMKDATLTPERRQRFLDTIYHNVTMLSRLVNELFELSKLDAKQTEPHPEPFSMAELAQDLVLEFQPQAEKGGVRLHASLPQDLPFVYGDIGMVERALSNLIENALRYTPQGGEVRVGLAPKGDRVRIEVADSGSGIPPEDLPYIFDRFYRVEKSRSRSSGGTGLGLAIARKIIELHEGRISVQSRLNAGTTFAFELAVYPGRTSPAREPGG